MFKHNTKAALNSYIAGTKPISGVHMVLTDESWYNEKIEYSYKSSALSRLSNPKIEFIRLVDVATFAAIATTYTTPVNKNMVVVLADETTGNKTTWYTYNVSGWVLMGEFLGTKMERSVSAGGTRGAVIHELTNYTIPFKYTVGRNELSIYVGGIKLSSTDFTEIGTSGVLSNIVQFTSAIMNGTEIEFVREVHTNQTTDPSYQIVQQKIIDDTIIRQRTEFLKKLGYTYGGTVQDCKSRDFSNKKLYWCNVNQKWYRPKLSNILGNMTAASTVVNGKTYVASASSEHPAPFPTWYAFSTNEEQFWHNVDDGADISASNTEWLKIDLGAKTQITHMMFSPRKGYETQVPDNFVIEGSDDGSAWTVLKTVTGGATFKAGSLLENDDLIAVSANSRYYRVTISKCYDPTENCLSVRQWRMFNIETSGKTYTVADSDWQEFAPEGMQIIPWTPTLNLLGNVTYTRRDGVCIKTDEGFKVSFCIMCTSDNTTQDGVNLELNLPVFMNGVHTGPCMSENLQLMGSYAGVGLFVYLGAAGKARFNSLNFVTQQVNTANRATQYYIQARSGYKGGPLYIYGNIDIIEKQ